MEGCSKKVDALIIGKTALYYPIKSIRLFGFKLIEKMLKNQKCLSSKRSNRWRFQKKSFFSQTLNSLKLKCEMIAF